jgi:hypothetical protein
MEIVSIYKNMEVSYQEFEQALLNLGYDKVPNRHVTLYVNSAFDSVISISQLNTPDRMMIKGEFAAQAFLMEMKGVLAHKDDIARMIEQSRLAQTGLSQTVPQGVAA